MKHTFSLHRLAIASVLALGLATTATNSQAATAPGMISAKAKVLKVEGNASYSSGGRAEDLTPGMEIPAGSVITTGPSGTVYLDLGESGRLTVKPDTTLSIDKLQVQATGSDKAVQTALEVKKGSILGNVKKLSAASEYKVTTAKGVAGIRGTAFQVFAIGIFRCSNGQLVVAIFNLSNPTAAPVLFTVTPGNECNASGGAPSVVQMGADIKKGLANDTRTLLDVKGPGGEIIVVVGTAEAVKKAVESALQNQNQSTTNPKPEKEMSLTHPET